MRTPPEYATFYAATWPRLLRVTYAITGDRQLAEDALQTAFALAYASWGKVQRADDPGAYVRRVAVNAALGHERKGFRRREAVSSDLPDTKFYPSMDHEVVTRDEVWTAVQALPARQRAVVVLRFYEDLTEQQIADVLGCRPGTVKSQSSAAMAKLRDAMRQVEPEGDRT